MTNFNSLNLYKNSHLFLLKEPQALIQRPGLNAQLLVPLEHLVELGLSRLQGLLLIINFFLVELDDGPEVVELGEEVPVDNLQF